MFTSSGTLLKFARALIARPEQQRHLSELLNRYLDEAKLLGHVCLGTHAVQGEMSATCIEEGLEGALWRNGVIGDAGVMVQLLLRFEYVETSITSIALRLRTMPLSFAVGADGPREATLTLPFGKALDPNKDYPPGMLSTWTTLGLKSKCSGYQEGVFREWLATAMSEWGLLETA